jgi:diguanylate cyclase (GGDEF)-like protein
MASRQHPLLIKLQHEHLLSLVLGFALLLILLSAHYIYLSMHQLQLQCQFLAAEIAPILRQSPDLAAHALQERLDGQQMQALLLQDSAGRVIAHANELHSTESGHSWTSVSSEIALDANHSAKLILQARLQPLLMDYLKNLLIAMGLCAIAMLLIWRQLTRHLQRECAPIAAMDEVMDMVQTLCDHSMRLPAHAVRELHNLSQSVNRLLDLNEIKASQSARANEYELNDICKMEILAVHDRLTRLPNRQYFHYALANCVLDAVNNQELAALMFIDLDNFSQINQHYGFDAANHVLHTLAQRFSTVLRSTDTLCHLSGDKFAAILPQVGKAEYCMLLAQRMQASLEQDVSYKGQKISVSASIGLACCSLHINDQQALLRRAGAALHAAKSAGKNTMRVFA